MNRDITPELTVALDLGDVCHYYMHGHYPAEVLLDAIEEYDEDDRKLLTRDDVYHHYYRSVPTPPEMLDEVGSETVLDDATGKEEGAYPVTLAVIA